MVKRPVSVMLQLQGIVKVTAHYKFAIHNFVANLSFQ
jgi:hypothetical protein